MIDVIAPSRRGVGAPALRDLGPDEFRSRYGGDRFTATVLASRFGYVIDHVCSRLLTTAFSPVIRNSSDFVATLSGPPSMDWPMAAVSKTIPIFLGSIPDGVRITMQEYGVDELREGDVVISNDPYRVGTHVNDVCFIRPLFTGDELIGALTIKAHMLDWGGRVAGGFDATKRDVYEDGLVVPPTLLYRAGRPIRSVFSLILDNIRFGSLILPDIQTIKSSLDLGEQLVGETIERYGPEAYLGAVRYVCDVSAETMRAAIEHLPDGVYEASETVDGDSLDDTIEYTAYVRVQKCGPRMEIDFSGSSPAARSAINSAWPNLKTAAAIALKFLIDPVSPFTSGSLRDVDIVAPPNSWVNALPPHCCMHNWVSMQAMMYAIFAALNGALGEDAVGPDSGTTSLHQVHGVRPDGSPWLSSSSVPLSGPWGATKHGDADTTQSLYIVNSQRAGVEEPEANLPLVVMRRDAVPDSAGPGFYRSGAATILDTLWLEPSRQYASDLHLKRPAGGGGVHGGGAGALGGAWLWDPEQCDIDTVAFLPIASTDPVYRAAIALQGVLDPETNAPDPAGTFHYVNTWRESSARTQVRLMSNGGGGWGDPLARDPLLVLRDVRDEYVTIPGAERHYGVIVVGDPHLDPEGLVIDEAATASRRAERRAAR